MDIVVAIVVIVSLLVGFLVGYLLRRKSESEKSSKIEQMSAEILTLTSEAAALRSAKQMLTAQIEDERVRSAQELEQQRTQWREDFNRELEIVSSQLKNETNRTNRESITEIMRPYQQQLEELKKQSGENRATLETHIKTLVETGGKLSSEADRLARALSSDVRMQGNLGEKLLEDLLAGSGLIEGKQYLLQRTIRQSAGSSLKNEDTGRVMKPDAMIFYPATKSVLYIDSKFQLPSDIDETMDASRQEEVLKDFSTRLRTQVKSLAARGYQRYKYEEYLSLPYVIMFVPSDKALMAVTTYDKTLWLDAFNSKVFIASERHLLMLIEMVSVMWIQQQHLDNQDKIVAQASVILDRVADFVDNFDDIGLSLERAVAAFEKTKKKGIGSGQTLSVAVRDMLKLGVKPQAGKQKKLDAQLADAGLEGSED
ncbi:MAG: DNA recombination protein RmuC [Alistipes sp.]|nr:DNA recombination protein RmuC [Alistipes sp.]